MKRTGLNALAVLSGIILCGGCSTTRTSSPPPVADFAPLFSVPAALIHTNAPASPLTGQTPSPGVVPADPGDSTPPADLAKAAPPDEWYWPVVGTTIELVGTLFSSR